MSNNNDGKTLALLLARKPRWEGGAEQSSSAWLISFTDVIALMLTFFVLLYSMSDPVQDKWDDKMGVTPHAAARYDGPSQNAGVNEGVNINRVDYVDADQIEYTEAVLKEILSAQGGRVPITLRKLEDHLYIDIDAQAFDKNNKINNDYSNAIKLLSPMLDNLDNQIVITGALKNTGGALMFLRAQTVARVLISSGYKKPVTIALRGDFMGDDRSLSILIQPHDGRRITR